MYFEGLHHEKTVPEKSDTVFSARNKTGTYLLSALAHLSEALAAVHRTVRLGLKGNLGLATAGSANSSEELTGATSGVLASITASLAALGLVLEAALCVELLFTGGENEFVAALFAC